MDDVEHGVVNIKLTKEELKYGNGAGMYSIGIASTIIIIVAQVVLHLRGGWSKHMLTKTIAIKMLLHLTTVEYIIESFRNKWIKVSDISVDKVGDLRNYSLTIEYSNTINEDDIVSSVEYDCLIKL